MKTHLLWIALVLCACSEALYPPRPPVVPGPPIADPPHTQLALHASFTREGLLSTLEGVIPTEDTGEFYLLGKREYRWERGPLDMQLDNAAGKVTLLTKVKARASLPLGKLKFGFDLAVETQPVLGNDYTVQFQAPVVTITTKDKLLRAGESVAGVLTLIRDSMEDTLESASFDLRPMLEPAYSTITTPVRFSIGEAQACVQIGVQSIEAGPTLLLGGFEKDIGLTLTPSVTMPCTAPDNIEPAKLPPLRNIPVVNAGSFEVIVPVAASYDELHRAMAQVFEDGKLYFSKEQPGLYLENPEIYASGGQLVVKVHVDGETKSFFNSRIYGDIYFAGHPEVRDNELLIPDLEPTVETDSLLLKLAAKIGKEDIRREVRQALRLDISKRLEVVKETLSKHLTYVFDLPSSETTHKPLQGCVQATVSRIELSDLFAHDSYLRLYVKVFGQASAFVPCPAHIIESHTNPPVVRHDI